MSEFEDNEVFPYLVVRPRRELWVVEPEDRAPTRYDLGVTSSALYRLVTAPLVCSKTLDMEK